jgi:hypothetical protein
MANEIENLAQAVNEWRGVKSQSGPKPKAKSPYGQKIYDLNMKWAETKKAHMAAIQAEEAKYREEYNKLTGLQNRWQAEQSRQQREIPDTARRGPKISEHSDEVKMAAAAAIRANHKKSLVRAVLGVSNTERLNRIIREGEELLQAEELKARDQKQDQATGEEW